MPLDEKESDTRVESDNEALRVAAFGLHRGPQFHWGQGLRCTSENIGVGEIVTDIFMTQTVKCGFICRFGRLSTWGSTDRSGHEKVSSITTFLRMTPGRMKLSNAPLLGTSKMVDRTSGRRTTLVGKAGCIERGEPRVNKFCVVWTRKAGWEFGQNTNAQHRGEAGCDGMGRVGSGEQGCEEEGERMNCCYCCLLVEFMG